MTCMNMISGPAKVYTHTHTLTHSSSYNHQTEGQAGNRSAKSVKGSDAVLLLDYILHQAVTHYHKLHFWRM